MQYSVKIPRAHSIIDIRNWCKEQYSVRSLTRYASIGRWTMHNDHIYFRDEKDMTFFLLRWSP